MTAGPFKDHFSGHATDYRAFRPDYPPDLFAFLASLAPGRHLAWRGDQLAWWPEQRRQARWQCRFRAGCR